MTNSLFADFLNDLKEYAEKTSYIESVLVVGSYARGTNKENSDLDIVMITSKKGEMVENQAFTKRFGTIEKKQIEYYGACTSIRVWYADGKEVEFGIVDSSWISVPLDEGTKKVLSDGFKILVDKRGRVIKAANRP